MRMKTTLAVLFIAALSSLSAQTATTPGKRLLTDKDLFEFVWVADPELSPDGAQVAFTRVNCDDKRTGYETSIWLAPTNGKLAPMRMTNGKHDTQPRWSADGKYLVFVRAGEKDDAGKPKPSQLALLSLAGGEARIITDLPKGASGAVWSPDSKRIAFVSDTTPEDIKKAESKKKTDSNAENEHESDVHVISRAIYRDNDEGYLDLKRHSHIWVLGLGEAGQEPGKPVQITSGNYDEGDLVWSNDGSHIYFLTRRVDEPYYELPATDIYSVASGGGDSEKLATIPMYVGNLTLSPDGRQFAFHGSVSQPVRSYSQPDLWVMDAVKDAKPRNLTADYRLRYGQLGFWR